MAGAALAQSAPAAKGPAANLMQPIVFYVAKGPSGACGPGCSEWIAAEGKIDPGAEPRLWELLHQLGNDRKLPVYFHSPGGSVIAGLQLGRLLRARGVTAGVGWTLPATCERKDPGAPACDALKRSGRELSAELDVSAGWCASSCSYTILGGAVRNIGVGAHIGIHDVFPAPTIRTFDETGHIVDRPLAVSAEDARSSAGYAYGMIAAYLNQMGISLDLMKAARSVSPDKLRELTREEIVGFGIDRRETVENAWSLVDRPTGVSAVKLVEARDGEGGAFRKAMLSLTCRDRTTVRLQYVREVAADESRPREVRVSAGGRSFPFMRLGGVAQGDNRPRVDNQGVELPLAALAGASFVIETTAPPGRAADDPAGPSVHLAVQAAAPAVAALVQRCGAGGR